MHFQPGQRISERYRILGSLAGSVYGAEDEAQGTPCVVKAIENFDLGSFMAENFLLARLDHPCLPVVRDLLVQEGVCCLVCDRIEGVSLAQWRGSGGQLTPEQVVRLALEILDPVEYLHGLEPPTVHGDLKPASLIRQKETGNLCLVGLALSRSSDSQARSSPFAPPDQSAGKVEKQHDLYAVGAIMRWLLPQAPQDALARVLQRACADEPAQRFQNAVEMRLALAEWLEQAPKKAGLVVGLDETAVWGELPAEVLGPPPPPEAPPVLPPPAPPAQPIQADPAPPPAMAGAPQAPVPDSPSGPSPLVAVKRQVRTWMAGMPPRACQAAGALLLVALAFGAGRMSRSGPQPTASASPSPVTSAAAPMVAVSPPPVVSLPPRPSPSKTVAAPAPKPRPTPAAEPPQQIALKPSYPEARSHSRQEVPALGPAPQLEDREDGGTRVSLPELGVEVELPPGYRGGRAHWGEDSGSASFRRRESFGESRVDLYVATGSRAPALRKLADTNLNRDWTSLTHEGVDLVHLQRRGARGTAWISVLHEPDGRVVLSSVTYSWKGYGFDDGDFARAASDFGRGVTLP